MAPESMKMPKPSEDSKAAFTELVPGDPQVTLKPMFGNLAAFVNGNMFAGLFGEDLFVRLPADQAAAVKAEGGRDFEPMAGRPMTGYVLVPSDWRTRPSVAEPRIMAAYTVTRELAAKVKKPKARKPA